MQNKPADTIYKPTLRDQFAMAAMQGMLAQYRLKDTQENFAKAAYSQADAMLKARAL